AGPQTGPDRKRRNPRPCVHPEPTARALRTRGRCTSRTDPCRGVRRARAGDLSGRPHRGWSARARRSINATEPIRIIKTPIRAPRANAVCERFVGTIRRECLDRLLILGRRHLEAVLAEYGDHYNRHRPHRSLEQRCPSEVTEATARSPIPTPQACGEPTSLADSSTSTGSSPAPG